MKINVSDATQFQLNWLVGLAEGMELSLYGVDSSIRASVPGLCVYSPWRPSYYWNQGGRIIDQMVKDGCTMGTNVDGWATARLWTENKTYVGSTLLEAAMRCYVASKLGDEVEIPDNIAKGA